MKSFVALLAVVAVVAADVSHLATARTGEAAAETVKQDVNVAADQYQYVYETNNGIQAQESGVLKNAGTENEAISATGSNQFTAPDGKKYIISYTADENGYQPQGDHLPTPPPPQEIPEYILRSIEYIKNHPAKPEPGQKY